MHDQKHGLINHNGIESLGLLLLYMATWPLMAMCNDPHILVCAHQELVLNNS